MFSFQQKQKKLQDTHKSRKIWLPHRKVKRKCPWGAHVLDLLDKDFTPAIINMLEELKETMYKEMKGKYAKRLTK